MSTARSRATQGFIGIGLTISTQGHLPNLELAGFFVFQNSVRRDVSRRNATSDGVCIYEKTQRRLMSNHTGDGRRERERRSEAPDFLFIPFYLGKRRMLALLPFQHRGDDEQEGTL